MNSVATYRRNLDPFSNSRQWSTSSAVGQLGCASWKPSCRPTDRSVACRPLPGRSAAGPRNRRYTTGIVAQLPPGAIGSRQLQRGGPLAGFFQPVEIKAPPGVLISLAVANQFGPPQEAPRRVGLLIGSVYRLRVTNIPLPQAEGMEIFPTIEIIDRTYAPIGPASPLRDSRGDRPARHGTGPARQVRHAGDLPGRSAQCLAHCAAATASRGSTWRRAAIRWRWPTNWAGRWRSSAWAAACRTRDRTPTSTLARRPGWLSAAHGRTSQARPRDRPGPTGRTRGKEAAAMKPSKQPTNRCGPGGWRSLCWAR